MFAKILSAISFLVLICFLAGQVQGTYGAETDWIIVASAGALVVGGYGIARPGKFTDWVNAAMGWANGNKPGAYLFSVIAAIAVVAA